MATSTTIDGKYFLTTAEQEGSLAGEAIGRIWIRNNAARCSSWRWLSVGNLYRAAQIVKAAAKQTAEEFNAWYDAQ